MTFLVAAGVTYAALGALALLFNRGAHRKPSPPSLDPPEVHFGSGTGTTGELVIENTSPTA